MASFWALRSGAPERDLPEEFGPYTTCYNRFVRWQRAGVWSRIIDALAGAHDAAVQMIDTSRASAWSLHHEEPASVDGQVARRLDEQNSCCGR
jgi:transposase